MPVVRDVQYEADGMTMIGSLGIPDQPGPRPAVLVAHEANGLDDQQKGRARHLAELGYVAFALDYHGGGSPPELSVAQQRTAALWDDPERMRALGQAGLDVLRAEPATDPTKVAAIGYCFGGALVLELGRSGADLRAIVGFHPGLRTNRPADSANIVGTVLICVGSNDPYVTLEDRATFEAEMRATEVDWRMHIYGGVEHSFTHPNADGAGLPGLRYHQPSAERSWRAMLELFDEVFAGQSGPDRIR
jgi:dienelactone hydrolase